MDLIEQLGGYAQAKALRALPAATYDCGIKFNREELELSMLEYRRQHNIFEVGDKVVIRKADSHPDLFIYESISRSGNMHFFESPFNYGHLDLCKVRHATDEEIKAGKRLEVNQ